MPASVVSARGGIVLLSGHDLRRLLSPQVAITLARELDHVGGDAGLAAGPQKASSQHDRDQSQGGSRGAPCSNWVPSG